MTVVFQKNATSPQQPASTIKLMNALVFRDWISDAMLDTTVIVTAADVVNFTTDSNAGLQVGDVLSYRDLLYGSLVPSGNDAAKCIARNVGALIISGGGPGASADPVLRFVEAMNARASSMGLTTAVFGDSFGFSLQNAISAADLAAVMIAVADAPLLLTVAGTMSRGLTITGANARTQTVVHTVQASIAPVGPIPMPEFVAAKTGTVFYSGADAQYDSGGCVAMLWVTPSGAKRVSVVLGSGATNHDRYRDLRKMMDFELARLGQL